MKILEKTFRFLKNNPYLANTFHRFDGMVTRNLETISFPIYTRLISNHWVKDNYEIDIRNKFKEICQRFKCCSFYDIGANVGIYTFEFLSLFPEGQVYAFEPHPACYTCLKKTKDKQNLSNLEIIDKAVSNKSETVNLEYNILSPSKGSIVQSIDSQLTTFEVETVFLDFLDIKAPDIIKIDAEGAEFKIFEGAQNILKNSRPILFFECARDSQKIKSLLSEYDYSFYDIKGNRIEELLGFNIALAHHELLNRRI